jgi:hypothetical protein
MRGQSWGAQLLLGVWTTFGIEFLPALVQYAFELFRELLQFFGILLSAHFFGDLLPCASRLAVVLRQWNAPLLVDPKMPNRLRLAMSGARKPTLHPPVRCGVGPSAGLRRGVHPP